MHETLGVYTTRPELLHSLCSIGYFSTSGRNFITGKLTIFGEPEVKNIFEEKKVQFFSVLTREGAGDF